MTSEITVLKRKKKLVEENDSEEIITKLYKATNTISTALQIIFCFSSGCKGTEYFVLASISIKKS